MKVKDPTKYFLKQETCNEDIDKENTKKLASQLIDVEKCIVCRKSYDALSHLPRIIVTCGHTYCSSCISLML